MKKNLNQTRKIIVIAGPTASGKTDLAKTLSNKFNGEVISADSRQIYRGMDIGTGKDKTFFQHMIDIRDPNEDFSVAEFQKETYKIIDNIFSRGRIPFLVGGSGLYINAVIYGYQFPKTDPHLRSKIESLSADELIEKLKKFDPASAEKNINNHRRLARALESYLYNSRPLSEYKKEKPNFQYLMLGIDIPREELYARIDRRVDSRIKEGMIEEIDKLLKSGVSYERLHRFGLEYRFVSEYLQQVNSQKYFANHHEPIVNCLKQEMIQKLKFKIHDFARRQLTWFRRNKEINWIQNDNQAEKLIHQFFE